MHAPAPAPQHYSLRTLMSWQLVGALVVSAAHLATLIAHPTTRLLYATLLCFLALVWLLVARWQLRRGHHRRAFLMAWCCALGGALLGAVQPALPALISAVIPLLATALALPFAEHTTQSRMLAASWGVSLLALVLGEIFAPVTLHGTEPLQATVAAVIVGLALLFLHQYVQRLRAADAAHQRLEQERNQVMRRLAQQIDRTPIGYLLHDEHFRFLYANPAAERIFGWRQEELLGRHPLDTIVPHSARKLVADTLERIAAGEMDAHGVNQNTTKSGDVIVCDWFNTPLFRPDGSLLGLVSMVQDITARVRAESALRASEQSLSATLDSIGDAVVATDRDGRITRINPVAERLTGWTYSEAKGRPIADVLDVRDAHSLEPVVEFADVLQDSTKLAPDRPVVLLSRTHARLPVALTSSPIRSAGAHVDGVVVICRDMSAQLRIEEQLRQSQKMEALGQLAGGVAHDFNNVLSVVLGFAPFVQEALPEDSGAQADLAEMVKAAERGCDLTSQLLAFSRRQVTRPQVINLNDLVQSTERMLRRLLGARIEFATKLAEETWPARIDPAYFEQLLVNLAINARDAMPKGGCLTVETANVHIDGGNANTGDPLPGDYVLLAVTDQGMGMGPEVLPRIFEPFFTTKESGQGTGLGLATCYGIVKQAGGHLCVHSEPRKGATFKVYLPRVQTLPELEAPPMLDDLPRGDETVLVAEDDPGISELTTRNLERLGYTVLRANSGTAAMQLLATYQGPLDLLLVDVMLPGVGGYEVVERTAHTHPQARVIYMSGGANLAPDPGPCEDGTAFLAKPFTLQALARLVRETLDQRSHKEPQRKRQLQDSQPVPSWRTP